MTDQALSEQKGFSEGGHGLFVGIGIQAHTSRLMAGRTFKGEKYKCEEGSKEVISTICIDV